MHKKVQVLSILRKKDKGDGMMERLTYRTTKGEAIGNSSVADIGDILEKLAEYEDLEEQGLLLRLPCKVGDTVWDNDCVNSYPYTITGFSFGTSEDYIDEPVSLKEVVYYCSDYSGSITGSFAVSEIGRTVFLTKEDAEQKLKEIESD